MPSPCIRLQFRGISKQLIKFLCHLDMVRKYFSLMLRVAQSCPALSKDSELNPKRRGLTS